MRPVRDHLYYLLLIIYFKKSVTLSLLTHCMQSFHLLAKGYVQFSYIKMSLRKSFLLMYCTAFVAPECSTKVKVLKETFSSKD